MWMMLEKIWPAYLILCLHYALWAQYHQSGRALDDFRQRNAHPGAPKDEAFLRRKFET